MMTEVLAQTHLIVGLEGPQILCGDFPSSRMCGFNRHAWQLAEFPFWFSNIHSKDCYDEKCQMGLMGDSST